MVSYPRDFKSIQNVEPEDDLIVHKWGVGCDCKPRKHLQMMGPHVIAAQIVHNALDGRE